MTRKTVLIIEDDEAMLRGLQDNFSFEGYRTCIATDGEEGIRAALLDIMLPGVNGFEVCRRIREAGLEMPIIMLTAKGQEEDILRGLNLGADDYVVKPFSIRELLARARAFLRRHRKEEPGTYRFGDFELDLDSHKLLRGAREVPLTPKEFRLLEYFLRRAGRALTREDILDTVWGRDILVTARSVDRCVATLRGKIEADPSRPRFIRTLRDIGYRFEVEEDRP